MAQSKKIEAEALETEAEGRKRAAIKDAEGKAQAIEIEVQFLGSLARKYRFLPSLALDCFQREK